MGVMLFVFLATAIRLSAATSQRHHEDQSQADPLTHQRTRLTWPSVSHGSLGSFSQTEGLSDAGSREEPISVNVRQARSNGVFQYQPYYREGEASDLAEGILESDRWRIVDGENGDRRQTSDAIKTDSEDGSESWWEGVEVVDLHQRPDTHTPAPPQSVIAPSFNRPNYTPGLTFPTASYKPAHSRISTKQELYPYQSPSEASENADPFACTENILCEGPPNFLNMPPPPMPPFMEEFLGHAFEANRMGLLGSPEDEDLIEECSLCRWAEEGNASLPLFAQEAGTDDGLAGLLAGVAVGSAVTGAILTAVFIRCRRNKVLPSSKDGCPVIPRGSWGSNSKQEASNQPHRPQQAQQPQMAAANPTEEENAPPTGTTSRTGWAMKLWRRASSQEQPLRPCSSYSSENSYTEEPYVNPEIQSAVYAELGTPGLNTYSEIPDPGRPGDSRHKYPLPEAEYTYGNGCYVMTESDPTESSSTPSSAYYSDISADVQSNKKKRKKKKPNEIGDDEHPPFYSIRRCSQTNISSSSAMPTVVRTRICENSHPLATIENVPQSLSLADQPLQISLRYLSRSYSLERPGLQFACSSCHSCSPMTTLPIVRHACPIQTNNNSSNLNKNTTSIDLCQRAAGAPVPPVTSSAAVFQAPKFFQRHPAHPQTRASPSSCSGPHVPITSTSVHAIPVNSSDGIQHTHLPGRAMHASAFLYPNDGPPTFCKDGSIGCPTSEYV